MKKFIKENWFKIGILIILVVVVFIYLDKTKVSDDSSKLIIPISQSNELPKAVSTPTTDINLQAKCSAQAEKIVTSYAETINTQLVEVGGHNINFYQQNHYNQTLNKCFVLISSDSGSTTLLFDAYENKRLATCSPQGNIMGNTSWLGTQIVNGMTYISQKECTNFVNQKMGLSQ